MIRRVSIAVAVLALIGAPLALPRAQKADFLTEEEEEKLREAQDPSVRIGVYLDLAQARLERFDSFRERPADPKRDTGAFLDSILDEYVSINGELKNWIDYEYERSGDMRRGLRTLLQRGPKQLEMRRHFQQTPDRFTPAYQQTLHDAMDDLKDTLDGGTKALADQQNKFGELEREEKADARAAKVRAKEEKKRDKEEKKLRKRERKHKAPADAEQD